MEPWNVGRSAGASPSDRCSTISRQTNLDTFPLQMRVSKDAQTEDCERLLVSIERFEGAVPPSSYSEDKQYTEWFLPWLGPLLYDYPDVRSDGSSFVLDDLQTHDVLAWTRPWRFNYPTLLTGFWVGTSSWVSATEHESSCHIYHLCIGWGVQVPLPGNSIWCDRDTNTGDLAKYCAGPLGNDLWHRMREGHEAIRKVKALADDALLPFQASFFTAADCHSTGGFLYWLWWIDHYCY